MAKSPETWEIAKALFEAGKSLSEITNETKLNRSSVSIRAKKEGWEKNKTKHLITDTVTEIVKITNKVKQLNATVQQNQTAQRVIMNEAMKAIDANAISEAWDMNLFYATNAAKRILEREDVTSNDILNIAKASEIAKIALNILPRFGSQNNTSPQFTDALHDAAKIIESP